jgi:hypothetical protein
VTRIPAGLLVVCAAAAQLPRIGDIDFYGLRTVTAEQILGAARLARGDTVPGSRVELEDRIADLPDVVAAYVQTICCEGNRATLFIGIEERGQPSVTFRAPPTTSADKLPADLMTRYRAYEGALLRAETTATAGYQDLFRAFAATHAATLRAVLRDGVDAEERAAAATVIRYAADKTVAADDLVFALEDPDDGVRRNAARSLAGLAGEGAPVPPERLVELLDSVVLSDRVESTRALLALTARPNAAALDLMRERALPSLAEMARWKGRAYARTPFQLLGRVAGLADAQVDQAWEKDDRQPVIQKALDSAGKKHRP